MEVGKIERQKTFSRSEKKKRTLGERGEKNLEKREGQEKRKTRL